MSVVPAFTYVKHIPLTFFNSRELLLRSMTLAAVLPVHSCCVAFRFTPGVGYALAVGRRVLDRF